MFAIERFFGKGLHDAKVGFYIFLVFMFAGCKAGMDYPPTPAPETVVAWQHTLAPRRWFFETDEGQLVFDPNGQAHVVGFDPFANKVSSSIVCMGGIEVATWHVVQLSSKIFVLRFTRDHESFEYRMTWSSCVGPFDGLILDGNHCHLDLQSPKRR